MSFKISDCRTWGAYRFYFDEGNRILEKGLWFELSIYRVVFFLIIPLYAIHYFGWDYREQFNIFMKILYNIAGFLLIFIICISQAMVTMLRRLKQLNKINDGKLNIPLLSIIFFIAPILSIVGFSAIGYFSGYFLPIFPKPVHPFVYEKLVMLINIV